MPEAGFIYILSNSIAERKIKVGRTNNLERRLREHNSASVVIGRWEIFWSLEVPDTAKAESLALSALKRWSVKGRREQFECDAQTAVAEVSVALAEWSGWGKQEKARREARALEKQRQVREARTRQAKMNALALEKEKDLATLNMLRETFADRKAEYDRAQRVMNGVERPNNPYLWGFSEAYLVAGFSGIIYWVAIDPSANMLPSIFLVMLLVQPSIDVWNRLKAWLSYDLSRERGAIENFQLVYPDGKPPETIKDVRAAHARVHAKFGE